MQKQYDQLVDSSGGTMEERMLIEIKEIGKYADWEEAAKACASIAQEEIDKEQKILLAWFQEQGLIFWHRTKAVNTNELYEEYLKSKKLKP